MIAFWWTRRARDDEQPKGPAEPPPPPRDAGLHERVGAKKGGEQCAPRPGERYRQIIYGARPEPMPSFFGPLEGPFEGRLGISCSGGGIRSAAFNLGVLQSLQEAKELQKAHYLAAVSGGSYIAAAFSMVAKRWSGSARPSPNATGHDDSNPAALDRLGPFAPGSPEEQYLRNRSSYLAPSGSDKLFLGFRIVLALVFNLVFLSLPLFAVGLLLGALLFRPFGDCTAHACHAVIEPGFWVGPVGLAGLATALGLWGLIRRSPSDRHREFLQTWSTRLLIVAAIAALVLVAAPALVEAFRDSGATDGGTGKLTTGGALGGAGGVAGLIAGLLAFARRAFSSPKALKEEAGKVRKAFAGLGVKTRTAIMYAAGAVVGPLLLFSALVLGASVALANSYPGGFEDGVMIGALGGLALFGLLYLGADVTSWSLHPFYKRRLSTAFALKRIRASDLTDEEKDRVQLVPPVKDQANDVGAAMERDYDELVPLSETALHEGSWPTLVVCAAANVSDPGAVPPGRSVTSFTFSAYSIGGPLIGGAKTKSYETAVGAGKPTVFARAWAALRSNPQMLEPRRARDLSLPAAVAMSGAALSPSMGKMTKRPLTFLLALANVRLGVWLPNPRWVMRTPKAKRRLFGRPRPSYLVKELLGRNRVNGKYVYVTDGGHYENLGLVELLRRGCTRIYCFDASGGEAFEELGEAIALARSELGVEVTIDPTPLMPDKETDIAETDTVVGTFTYRDEKRTAGKLVYSRNVLTNPTKPPAPAGAPWDARAYHLVDPKFPHNSTVDQLYTDQKFEGYRVLGEVAGKRAISEMHAPDPG